MARLSINGVRERGSELTEQAVERGNELKAQVLEGGGELGHRASESAAQARTGRLAKFAGARLASIRTRRKAPEVVSPPRKMTVELVALASGVVGSAVAGAVFNRVWRAVSGAEQAPEPTALDRNIRGVLAAATLQGAVFGLVKAAVGRLTARGYRRLTGNDLS